MTLPDLWLAWYNTSLASTVHHDIVHSRMRNLHEATMSIFGEPITRHGRSEKNILWRLEKGKTNWSMLIQSTRPPTAMSATLPHVTIKKATGFLEKLTPDTKITYRIAVAPQSRIRANAKINNRGKDCDVLLTSEQAINRWRSKFAPRAGIVIDPDTEIVERRFNSSRSNKTDPTQFCSDLFSGTATIANQDSLQYAIMRGIGLRKAYGCGLLSVLPTA